MRCRISRLQTGLGGPRTVQRAGHSPPCARTILSPCCDSFWLFFAQACTLCVAALFVVSTLRPDLLPRLTGRVGSVIVTQETTTPVVASKVASYADAAKKAMPAVVNIYTSKEVRTRNPLADDPLFRRYFPDLDRSGDAAPDESGLRRDRVERRLRASPTTTLSRAPTTSSSC